MTRTRLATAAATVEISDDRDSAPLRIGTRGSALALAQAQQVMDALGSVGSPSEFVTVETDGDRRAPDTAWGEGAFVRAIERALLDGRTDIAVHSAKDVPTDEHPALRIVAYLPRADARDALVGPAGMAHVTLATLPPGARVGTDSPRRTGFLLARRPDLQLHPLSGNVDTRLGRLDSGDSDALVLAAAGLERLGRNDRIGEYLDPPVVPPAPGQGAIAVQVRAVDDRASRAVAVLDHAPTRAAVAAERAFLAASGGGCRAPIGAYAWVEGDRLVMVAGYTDPGGARTAFEQLDGPRDDPASLGRAMARRLVHTFGARPARVSSGVGATAPGVASDPGRRVLVTRAAEQAADLIDELVAAGLEPVAVPCIAIEPAVLDDGSEALLRALPTHDWVVVTSTNGARAIVRAAAERDLTLAGPRWAAVGTATARTLADAGIDVTLIPDRTSAAGLAAELPLRGDERVLLARGSVAGDELPARLRARGAVVEELVVYRTVEAPETSRERLRRALDEGVSAVVFTSGSTVRGAVALAGDARERLLAIPAICIGPETADVARVVGFTVAREAHAQDARALAREVAALGRTTGGPA